MIRLCVLGLVFMNLFATAHAAVVITIANGSYVSEQYFEKGEFVLLQDEKPSMGIDAQGNCWFVDRGRLISDTCEEMLQSMNAMREDFMAGLSKQDRAIMERAMEMQRAMPPLGVSRIGTRKIAGYQAECHRVGSRRELCISGKLLDEVEQEMGDGQFAAMIKRFGESVAGMGADNPESRAVAELSERGFPMRDVQQMAALPGINSAVLKTLPEAQRNEIMQQMGTGGDVQMRGNQVSRVVKDGTMPELDFSHFRRISFQQFLKRSEASRSSKWEGFPPQEQ